MVLSRPHGLGFSDLLLILHVLVFLIAIVTLLNLFIYRQGTDTAYLHLYVDNIVLIASSEVLLQRVIMLLHQEFSMTDHGSLNYFMGILVTRNSLGMFLSQRKYAAESLNLSQTQSKLGADGDLVSDLTLYRRLVGALQYLTITRLDICYAVQQVCIYMHNLRDPHLSALRRILRYVRGTLDYGLQLYPSCTISLVASSDAD
jgi:hypothetical protein